MTMNNKLKKTISIKIKKLDIFPNHFFGIAEINREKYKINIQGQSMLREKLIKLPIKFRDEKRRIRMDRDRFRWNFVLFSRSSGPN